MEVLSLKPKVTSHSKSFQQGRMYNINVIAQFKLLSTLSLIGPVVLTAIVNISSRSDNRAAVLLILILCV